MKERSSKYDQDFMENILPKDKIANETFSKKNREISDSDIYILCKPLFSSFIVI